MPRIVGYYGKLKILIVTVINQLFYGQRLFGRCLFGSAWEGGLGPCGCRWQGQGYRKQQYSGNGSSMLGEDLEEAEELQRGEQEGMESFLGTADSSVDQQHRTTF